MKISVIIPTFNREKFIIEAINSVLSQTQPADEIIVIDDGSTDSTESLIQNIKDSRLKYIFKENGGVSSARNLGLKIAQGEHIAFLDSDDIWLSEMLEQQIKAISTNPNIAFSVANFSRFNDSAKAKFGLQFEYYPELIKLGYESDTIKVLPASGTSAFADLVSFGEFPAFTQAIMFRSAKISGLKFNENLSVCEDAEFVLRASKRGCVTFNPNVLLKVRRHDGNTTADWSNIAYHKLQALMLLNDIPDIAKPEKLALDKRLVKARVDAAISMASSKEYLSSLQLLIKLWMNNGSLRSKARGTLKVIFKIVTSIKQRKSKLT